MTRRVLWYGMTDRFRWAWHTNRRPRSVIGLLRMWWHDFVIHPLFEGTEVCEDCGRSDYPLWHADEALWNAAMGCKGGLLCPTCFSERMDKLGTVIEFEARVLRQRR